MPPRRQPLPDALKGRPFTVGEAADAGVTRRQLSGASFSRAFRGVHMRADESDAACLARRAAAALAGLPPETVVSHATAAELYGLPVRPDARST